MTEQIEIRIDGSNSPVHLGMSASEVVSALGQQNFERIESHSCLTSPMDVNGVLARLAMTFSTRGIDRIEVISTGQSTLNESFERLQKWLVDLFGEPDVTGDADGGFMYHHWSGNGVKVSHTVVDRFVLAEHLSISRECTSLVRLV